MLVVAVYQDYFDHAPPSDNCSSVLANTEGFPQAHYIHSGGNIMLYSVTTSDNFYDTAGAIMLRVTLFLRRNRKNRA